MAKIIYLSIILLVTGCQENSKRRTYQDFQAQGYSLVLGSNFVDVQFNMENDSICATLLQSKFVYRDTMHLSESEENEIASSFFDQKIFECEGHIDVNGKRLAFPRVSNDIHLYRHKKKIATLSVLKDYEPEGLFPDRRERRIVKFSEVIWKILNRKTKYKIAEDSLKAALRTQPILRI